MSKLIKLHHLNLIKYASGLYFLILTLALLPHTPFLLFNNTALIILLALVVPLSLKILITKNPTIEYLLIALILMSMATQNPYTITAEQGYLTYFLLACSYANHLDKKNQSWHFLQSWIWIILGYGYFLSAIEKLFDPQWLSGNALYFIFHNFTDTRALAKTLTDQLPASIFTVFNYFILLAELLFLPALYYRRARRFLWTILTGMQLIALVILPIPDINFGMLLIHLFCMNASPEKR